MEVGVPTKVCICVPGYVVSRERRQYFLLFILILKVMSFYKLLKILI